jgi:CRISPR-associated protein Csb2
MNRYLCLSVTFLDPFFHGKGDDEPEWPPSPLRFFQALLAGARTGCRSATWSKAKVDAFRWLENRPPPRIVAPSAIATSGYRFFVPNNDGDREFDRQDRLTTKIARPHRLLGGDRVHYLWPLVEEEWTADQEHVDVLCREARNLLALGWGIDLVAGDGRILTDNDLGRLAGQHWQPSGGQRPGERTWRVPASGTLDDLERAHQSFLARWDGKIFRPAVRSTRFEVASYLRVGTVPPRSYAAFELPEGVAFLQEDTAKVAAMLRSLAGRCAHDDTHLFPGGPETYVAGHIDRQAHRQPRFSYLPLPTIRHDHADGMIRRLLIAEPLGGDGTHAAWAQQRLRGEILRDKEGRNQSFLHDLWRVASRKQIERYVTSARVWTTVTPVILPGFDDGKHIKAQKLVFSALEQAGLPLEAIQEVILRKGPFWSGSLQAHHYFRPDYLHRLPGWHVRLVFQDLVAGPLAIGAGRHVGLGLFARSDEE